MVEPQKPVDVTNVKEATEKNDGLVVVGNGDSWRLLNKAGVPGKWMKSSKAYVIDVPGIPGGIAVALQVTSEHFDKNGEIRTCGESVTNLPSGLTIAPDINKGRKLQIIDPDKINSKGDIWKIAQ